MSDNEEYFSDNDESSVNDNELIMDVQGANDDGDDEVNEDNVLNKIMPEINNIRDDDSINNIIDDDDDIDELFEDDADNSESEDNVNASNNNLQSNINSNYNFDSDNDSDDDYDENYLQKFDKEITQSYINDFHPESNIHNFDEINKLSIVVRNEFNDIIDPLHKTMPFMTKFEKTRILGQRAKQIETGSKPFVSVPDSIIDAYLIAEIELKEKKIPFIIKRPLPNGSCEYWRVKDLEQLI